MLKHTYQLIYAVGSEDRLEALTERIAVGRLILRTFIANGGDGYAPRAVQFHPHGGQSDSVWLSARTPHGAYVW